MRTAGSCCLSPATDSSTGEFLSINVSTTSAGSSFAHSLNSVVHRSTSGDTVQLVEQSLDTNLLNNAIKIKFLHCTVLPGGIQVQENLNNIIILICTNQSVHRLRLAHPTRMYRSVSRRHLMPKGIQSMSSTCFCFFCFFLEEGGISLIFKNLLAE